MRTCYAWLLYVTFIGYAGGYELLADSLTNIAQKFYAFALMCTWTLTRIISMTRAHFQIVLAALGICSCIIFLTKVERTFDINVSHIAIQGFTFAVAIAMFFSASFLLAHGASNGLIGPLLGKPLRFVLSTVKAIFCATLNQQRFKWIPKRAPLLAAGVTTCLGILAFAVSYELTISRNSWRKHVRIFYSSSVSLLPIGAMFCVCGAICYHMFRRMFRLLYRWSR